MNLINQSHFAVLMSINGLLYVLLERLVMSEFALFLFVFWGFECVGTFFFMNIGDLLFI